VGRNFKVDGLDLFEINIPELDEKKYSLTLISCVNDKRRL
jgi:hypothetical protein